MPTTPYGAAALQGELQKLKEATPPNAGRSGNRNDTLNRTWFKVSQLIEQGHIERADAERQFQDTALGIGLSPGEVHKTMNSGSRGASTSPRHNTPEPKGPDSDQASGGSLDDRLGSVDVETSDGAFDDMYLPRSALSALPQAESWIDGVLDKRCLFSITGRGGTYKSFLALAWLACLATGREWLGRSVTQARVLYIIGEGLYGVHSRLAAWEAAWQTQIPDDRFHIRRAPVNLFKRGSDTADLYGRIQRDGYDVILFDTLQRASTGADTNLAKDAGLIVHTMGQLRDANPNAAIGYVAHLGKSEEAGTRGSTALEDDLDIVWRVSNDDDADKIMARMVKRRDGPEGLTLELQTKPIQGTDSLILESYKELGGISLKHPKWVVPVLEVLASKLARDGLSQSRIMQAVGMSSWASMRATADWLIEHDMAVLAGSGTRMRIKITEHGISTLERMKAEESS